MSDTQEPVTNVFHLSSSQPIESARDKALRAFHEMVTPDFLTQLNDDILRGEKSQAWHQFSTGISSLQYPEDAETHRDEWQLFLIGAVKRDDVMMVKMCASELHSPDSMVNHPLMQEKLTIVASAPAQPYLRVVR